MCDVICLKSTEWSFNFRFFLVIFWNRFISEVLFAEGFLLFWTFVSTGLVFGRCDFAIILDGPFFGIFFWGGDGCRWWFDVWKTGCGYIGMGKEWLRERKRKEGCCYLGGTHSRRWSVPSFLTEIVEGSLGLLAFVFCKEMVDGRLHVRGFSLV